MTQNLINSISEFLYHLIASNVHVTSSSCFMLLHCQLLKFIPQSFHSSIQSSISSQMLILILSHHHFDDQHFVTLNSSLMKFSLTSHSHPPSLLYYCISFLSFELISFHRIQANADATPSVPLRLVITNTSATSWSFFLI